MEVQEDYQVLFWAQFIVGAYHLPIQGKKKKSNSEQKFQGKEPYYYNEGTYAL